MNPQTLYKRFEIKDVFVAFSYIEETNRNEPLKKKVMKTLSQAVIGKWNHCELVFVMKCYTNESQYDENIWTFYTDMKQNKITCLMNKNYDLENGKWAKISLITNEMERNKIYSFCTDHAYMRPYNWRAYFFNFNNHEYVFLATCGCSFFMALLFGGFFWLMGKHVYWFFLGFILSLLFFFFCIGILSLNCFDNTPSFTCTQLVCRALQEGFPTKLQDLDPNTVIPQDLYTQIKSRLPYKMDFLPGKGFSNLNLNLDPSQYT